MLIGYARVSTQDQDLSMQSDALTGAGCETVYSDKASGASLNRPGLADALRHARSGDCLVVWKLDRLGRTMKGLVELMGELGERKIDFRSLTDGIDTTTPVGRFAFHMLAAVAEMERELVKERTAAALAARRKHGGGGGRKPALTPRKLDTARRLIAAGEKPKDIAEMLKVSVATFYRYFPAGDREAA